MFERAAWFGLRDRDGWLRDSSTALPAPASPHCGDGHGGGGTRGAEHLVFGDGGRTD